MTRPLIATTLRIVNVVPLRFGVILRCVQHLRPETTRGDVWRALATLRRQGRVTYDAETLRWGRRGPSC